MPSVRAMHMVLQQFTGSVLCWDHTEVVGVIRDIAPVVYTLTITYLSARPCIPFPYMYASTSYNASWAAIAS